MMCKEIHRTTFSFDSTYLSICVRSRVFRTHKSITREVNFNSMGASETFKYKANNQ